MSFKRTCKINAYFLPLFFASNILAEGLITGTLIKTPSGQTPIENLKKGDKVISYDFKNSHFVEDVIIGTQTYRESKFILLVVKGKTLVVSVNHKFFFPLRSGKRWVVAQDLKPGDLVLDDTPQLVKVDEIHSITGGNQVHSLSIQNNHNFLANNILVHNFYIIPALVGAAKAIAAAIAGCEVSIATTGLTMALGGMIVNDFNGKRCLADPNTVRDVGIGAAVTGSLVYAFRAPGQPGDAEGYNPPKNWDGEKVRAKSGQYGYPDKSGDVWVPTGEGSGAHAGPHWDVIDKRGNRKANVYPGGHRR